VKHHRVLRTQISLRDPVQYSVQIDMAAPVGAVVSNLRDGAQSFRVTVLPLCSGHPPEMWVRRRRNKFPRLCARAIRWS
jgi:hypothetical protein